MKVIAPDGLQARFAISARALPQAPPGTFYLGPGLQSPGPA
jgi:hypothetical protein